ncbi:hypothetical protein PHLGIDRAFT_124574 [Phlebiopsis gigantea 11061_1 CR5-6]|uniref:RNA helicase n=1 Tax=Phlebiopsis gigantea (strain 11061_1 CR5-6) TaxID=745531 RepID=A0A0C3SDL0_PHLG1|nr:hypothetical protein PHLGIDRAFT_124574 [Phlebiopsis gigantea 11061_1 CR5-6]
MNPTPFASGEQLESLHSRGRHRNARGRGSRGRAMAHATSTDLVRDTRPSMWSTTKWVVPLLQYKIPAKGVVNVHAPHAQAANTESSKGLTLDSYAAFFQHLLWIEEEHMADEMTQHNMNDVPITSRHPGYEIKVVEKEGFSVIVGDIVHVQHTGSVTDKCYQGRVHHVKGQMVHLRFNDGFSVSHHATVDVKLILNRLPLRRMHQAVTSGFNVPRLLFPTEADCAPLRILAEMRLPNLHLADKGFQENSEQLQAITAIVLRPPGSVPFVLFGPPGTGRRETLVESIRLILKNDPAAKVLVCAPSNKAADLIAKLLTVHLEAGELCRLNSYARPYNTFMQESSELNRYTMYNDNEVFAIPPREKLQAYRVVVSTCISAAIPHALGLERGHFSHIFLDEAGLATEPTSMVAIKTLMDDRTNVVLAGDHRQLSPIVRSRDARRLQLSFLDRLMSMPIYNEQTSMGRTVVKLVKNFRSHPDILHYPNQIFYGGELEACGNPAVTHSLLEYEGLPQRGFPIVFHGTYGRESAQSEADPHKASQRREAPPSSFFNVEEINVVRKHVIDLVDNHKLRITPNDIGIIAPYRAQRQKIVATLPKQANGIKVGSVEDFQGEERRVIIVSTVRNISTEPPALVADPRRFNVAMTRARSLLIIVGDPRMLARYPLWQGWLTLVHEKGGCRGHEPDWNAMKPAAAEGGSSVAAREKGDAQDMIERIRAQLFPNLAPLGE